MAKIYFRRYKQRIDDGELTVQEAIDLAGEEVPKKWRSEVIVLLRELEE